MNVICFDHMWWSLYQRDPKGHSPAFWKQKIPARSPVSPFLTAHSTRLMNQQHRNTSLRWSGQPGTWNQRLASHPVELLKQWFHHYGKHYYYKSVFWHTEHTTQCVHYNMCLFTCWDIRLCVTLCRTDASHSALSLQWATAPLRVKSLARLSSNTHTFTQWQYS